MRTTLQVREVRKAEAAAIQLREELKAKEALAAGEDSDSAQRRIARRALLQRTSAIERKKPEKASRSRTGGRMGGSFRRFLGMGDSAEPTMSL